MFVGKYILLRINLKEKILYNECYKRNSYELP